MVTILPKENDWSEAFQSIGQGVTQGYQTRADEMALQKAIMDLGDNPPPDKILSTILGTKTYNTQAKQNLFKNTLGIEQFKETQRHAKATEAATLAKKQTDISDAMSLLENSDMPQERKQQLANDIQEGKASYKAIKEIVKPKKNEPTSNFQKGLDKENVKLYVDAEKSIVQSQRNLNDLEKIEKLNEKISGPLGYVRAFNPFNEDAAQLSALGFGVIEPIVKIFNPSGPIAQKKLEQLQKRYGISATDSSASIRGKVAALKRYAGYAKDIAEQRIELFKKYDGSPPLGEIARLDAEGEKIVEQMEAENPTEPKIYYSTSNGKPVKAKSLEQQEELIKKGLITDVKPKS